MGQYKGCPATLRGGNRTFLRPVAQGHRDAPLSPLQLTPYQASESHHKALEVFGFGEAGLAGVIRRLAEVVQELNRPFRIACRPFDHFAEELAVHQDTAGIGEQYAAGIHELARQQVDILVGPQPLLHLGFPADELRGIEDNQVEALLFLAKLPKLFKGIPQPVVPVGRIAVGVQGELPVR